MGRAYVLWQSTTFWRRLAAAGLLVSVGAATVASCSSGPPGGPTQSCIACTDSGSAEEESGLVDHTVGSPPGHDAAPDGPTEAAVTDAPLDGTGGSMSDVLTDGPAEAACPDVCSGTCTNVLTDANNCGQCGNICGMNGTCVGGTCICPSPATNCGNQCVNTTSDSSNCGQCAHNCQGTACTDSLCVPGSIAVAGGTVDAIAVDSANVYWTLGATSTYSGGVYLKPLAGGNNVALSATDYNPQGIAVDPNSTLVFWAAQSDHAIGTCGIFKSMQTSSPSYIPYGGASYPLAVTTDAANVYWTDYNAGAVYQEPLLGGTITTLATGRDKPVAIAVDTQNVYWLDYGTVVGTGSVNFVPIGADAGVVTSLATSQTEPLNIAVDPTFVYWTSKSNPGSVQAIPIASPGGTPIVIADNQGSPYGIVVDGLCVSPPCPPRFVYWTNFDNNNVNKAPVPTTADAGATGSIITIATGQNNPAAMAIDKVNVYWASQGNGQIYKVVK